VSNVTNSHKDVSKKKVLVTVGDRRILILENSSWEQV